jgi:hypothetical protein
MNLTHNDSRAAIKTGSTEAGFDDNSAIRDG